MECSKKIKELRESTGMNRREFCEYFDIPYRTVTEWERDNRHAPEYVLRLLEYYIRMQELMKEKELVKICEGRKLSMEKINEIVFFETEDKTVTLSVPVEQETSIHNF